MITSVAVQAYLTKIKELFNAQGFDPDMPVIYDSENAKSEEWLSDELANTRMKRKGTTTKDDVRKGPFMALFWTRTSLEPIIRQRYRLLDTPDEGVEGPAGKSTVSAKFRIACAFVTNKAEAVEDLEEAFAAVFQNTYNMPVSLQYIYNGASDKPEMALTNFTLIQNMGESDLVNFKEGNLFAYAWSADIFMNYVSEFAWSRVYPVEKIVIDLYGPRGIPISSLDAIGHVHTHTHTAVDGTVVENVPDEPSVAFTAADPHEYIPFAISAPYTGVPVKISPEARVLIESAIISIGGEISLRGTEYMLVANMPLSLNHKDDATRDDDIAATASVIIQAIRGATGEEYVVTPMPANG